MTIPSSGTYSGLYLYEMTGVPGVIGDTLADLQSTYLQGSGLALPTEFLNLVQADSTATFDGSDVTFTSGTNTLSLDDSETYAQGPTGFGFVSGGDNYVVSNSALSGVLSLDTILDNFAAYFQASGNGTAYAAFETAKALVDAAGLGNLYTVVDGGIFNDEPYQPPCFVRGTLIRTVTGDVAVEALRPGDRVMLARGGDAPIAWVGHRRVRIEATDKPELQRPIRVRAGALAAGVPARDLLVSPDHALFLDGVLVPAGLLADGDRIRPEAVDTVEYFHVELDRHDVLLAENAPAESYLDTGNRHTFANADLVTLRPAFPAVDEARVGTACAELVLGGERLDAIRARLALVPEIEARLAS